MKRPACGAVIEVQLAVGTDVTKTKAILQQATEQDYNALPWKQSLKRQALSTILITQEILRDPTTNQLYNSLRINPNNTLKEGDVTFKLSKLDNGTEFLQRWQRIKE